MIIRGPGGLGLGCGCLLLLHTLLAAAAAASAARTGDGKEAVCVTLPTVSTPVALLFVAAVLATTAVLRLVRQRQLRREAGRRPAVVAPLAAAVAPPTAASPAASIYASSNAKSDDWQALPIVNQDSGIISPFAAIMPIFEPEEDAALEPPTTPTRHVLRPASPSPEQPSSPVAARTQFSGPLKGNQEAVAGSAALPAAGEPAAAAAPARSTGGGLPVHQMPCGLSASISGWLVSLLRRGWSEPTEVGAGMAAAVAEEAAAEDDSAESGGRARQAQLARPYTHLSLTPLPIRKRGSAACLGSLQSPGRGSSSGGAASPSPRALPGELPLMDLDLHGLSDWEVAPEEIEIMKRPDGSDWELGAGGFGRVYKALRNGVQPVAVKVLTAASSEAREAYVSDMRREVTILKACKDPNVVAFLGACLQEDATMLVTEYCEGGSLTRNIMCGRVSWWQRGRKVALDVARGLVFLHSRRIVHFDLKSMNVLLTRDGTAKIADLGMAKIVGREFSAVSGNLGTLAWAAPEMLLGARCTEKADIYSFGVLLWEICTGEAPQRGQLRDVRVPEECPAEVRELILDCLDPSPRVRPTALQLVERLQAASGVAPGMTPASPAAGARGALRTPHPAAGRLPPPPAQLRGQAQPAAGAGRLPLRAASGVPPAVGFSVAQAAPVASATPPASHWVVFQDREVAEPTSPFAGGSLGTAAAAPAAAASTAQHAQHEADPAQHGAARPPRPPGALGRSASSDTLRRHSAAANAGAAALDPAAARALHSCPLYPMLSQQIRSEQSSPPGMDSLGEASLLSQHLATGGTGCGAGSTAAAAHGMPGMLPAHHGAPPTPPHHPHHHGGSMAHPRSEPLLAGHYFGHDAPSVLPPTGHGQPAQSGPAGSGGLWLARPLQWQAAAAGSPEDRVPDDVWGRLLFNM